MYIKLCDVSILNVDEPRSFKVNDQEIMVIWHAGNFYCLCARCTHAGAPIADGTVNEQVLTCPWHYSQFDIATGAVLRVPAKKPLKFYKSELRDGSLFIDL